MCIADFPHLHVQALDCSSSHPISTELCLASCHLYQHGQAWLRPINCGTHPLGKKLCRLHCYKIYMRWNTECKDLVNSKTSNAFPASAGAATSTGSSTVMSSATAGKAWQLVSTPTGHIKCNDLGSCTLLSLIPGPSWLYSSSLVLMNLVTSFADSKIAVILGSCPLGYHN